MCDRIEYAKRLLPNVATPERAIVQAIIDNPNAYDTAIAKIVGTSKTRVQVVRKQLGIPPVFKISKHDVPAEDLIEDNTRLDAGECRINLSGDYLKRYLEIRSYKMRQKKFKPIIYY